jgi:hypothetical protein
MVKKVKGLCYGCVRFHPKAAGNCVLARAWLNLEGKHKYSLMVVDCPLFLPAEEVFPDVEDTHEKAKSERTGNKKIDEDESLV